jgi:hypothetical protein
VKASYADVVDAIEAAAADRPSIQQDLDDMVNDVFDDLAAEVNGRGIRAQVEWLLKQGCSTEEILDQCEIPLEEEDA